MIEIPKLMMVFDVESVGLHGEGFAVGWTIINDLGVEISSALLACDREVAQGLPSNQDWVNKNIPALASLIHCDRPEDVRERFWRQWEDWKRQGALLFAECAWPVEANFLEACVLRHLNKREFEGPYPFHEIASIMLAAGMNPMAPYPREEREQPPHNPLADARQSARLLMTAFQVLNAPDRYSELIMAVARKFPGESRHETALRYINQAEKSAIGSKSENAKAS